mmetsp:Transcript_19600/g.34986  ORF Transcript_19600/g.34986 Transcript_19600/m.34986 type:complete len:206 (+) Transcript_19600:323-940(+)
MRRTSGVKGTGFMILPLYARPPMPDSAIQHVSRRSCTFFPSRVVSSSAWKGTSLSRAGRLSCGSDSTPGTMRKGRFILATESNSAGGGCTPNRAHAQMQLESSLAASCAAPAATRCASWSAERRAVDGRGASEPREESESAAVRKSVMFSPSPGGGASAHWHKRRNSGSTTTFRRAFCAPCPATNFAMRRSAWLAAANRRRWCTS